MMTLCRCISVVVHLAPDSPYCYSFPGLPYAILTLLCVFIQGNMSSFVKELSLLLVPPLLGPLPKELSLLLVSPLLGPLPKELSQLLALPLLGPLPRA